MFFSARLPLILAAIGSSEAICFCTTQQHTDGCCSSKGHGESYDASVRAGKKHLDFKCLPKDPGNTPIDCSLQCPPVPNQGYISYDVQAVAEPHTKDGKGFCWQYRLQHPNLSHTDARGYEYSASVPVTGHVCYDLLTHTVSKT